MKYAKRLLLIIALSLTAIAATAINTKDSLNYATEQKIQEIEDSKFGPYEEIKPFKEKNTDIKKFNFDIDFRWLNGLGEILKRLLIIVAVLVAVIGLIAIIAHFNGIDLWRRKKEEERTTEGIDPDSIENRNFEKEIEDCLQKFDYSGAVKVIYMAVVSDLNDHDQIKWDLAKTTSDYYYEIKEAAIKKLYYSFALIYLQVRYGNTEATADTVMQAKQFRSDMSKLYPNKNTDHA